MSKNTKWVFIFALVVMAYAANQYFEEHRGNTFKSPLLSFFSEEVTQINIHQQGDMPFQLLKLDGKWFVIAEHIYETAIVSSIEELLDLLRKIRTAEIESQDKDDWDKFELTDEQGTLVCIESPDEKWPCIRFGSLVLSSEERKVRAFARVGNQDQVYAINGFSISKLKGNCDDYRNKQVLNIEEPLIELKCYKDTSVLKIFRWNNTWVNQNLDLVDSMTCEHMIENLKEVQLINFADNLDELTLESKRIGTVRLFTAHDSFKLECFVDSTSALPFILHSDQFPKTWMACDSSTFLDLLPADVLDW